MLKCPNCKSDRIVKNGHIHNGKQNFLCRICGQQFVENPTQKLISQETMNFINKLLLERISLTGIARVTNISEAGCKTMSTKNTKQHRKK